MTSIVKFIKHPRKNNHLNAHRIGVVIATPLTSDPKKIGVGWSLAAVAKGDKYDEDKGIRIALNRANKGSNKSVPKSIIDDVLHMHHRASKYFKDCEVID